MSTGTRAIPLSSPSIDERDEELVLEVLRSGRLSLGPTIDRFEELIQIPALAGFQGGFLRVEAVFGVAAGVTVEGDVRAGAADQGGGVQDGAQAAVVEDQVEVVVHDGLRPLGDDISGHRLGRAEQDQRLIDQVRAEVVEKA